MSFQDIFKSDFYNNITSFSLLDTMIALVLALVIGLFIFVIYRKNFQGVMYSETFGISLVAMCMITTFIILAVTSNVVLSLGMVGALSIVRFRTAIKEPMEICYIFWAIGVGIVIGAGMIPLAVIGSILIGIILLVLVNRKHNDNPYILVVTCANDAAEQRMYEKMGQYVKKHIVKSKTVSKMGIELTVEIRLKDMTTEFINQLVNLEGVEQAVLVSYNGEYMS